MAKYVPQIGDVVRSKVNGFYKGTYTITNVNKHTVWCIVDIADELMQDGVLYRQQPIYKNVKPSILQLVSRKEANDSGT